MDSDNANVENDIVCLSQIKNQTAGVIRHIIQSEQYAGERKNNGAKYNSYRDSVEAQAAREDNSITSALKKTLRASQSQCEILIFSASKI